MARRKSRNYSSSITQGFDMSKFANTYQKHKPKSESVWKYFPDFSKFASIFKESLNEIFKPVATELKQQDIYTPVILRKEGNPQAVSSSQVNVERPRIQVKNEDSILKNFPSHPTKKNIPKSVQPLKSDLCDKVLINRRVQTEKRKRRHIIRETIDRHASSPSDANDQKYIVHMEKVLFRLTL